MLRNSFIAAAALLFASAALAGDAADPRLGEEVGSICFARSINGWKALDGEDDVVLLNRGVKDWYRVGLSGSCRERDFRFAELIGIDSRPAGGCVTRGDVIIVKAAGNFNKRCFISSMHRWNDDLPAPAEDEETPESAEES